MRWFLIRLLLRRVAPVHEFKADTKYIAIADARYVRPRAAQYLAQRAHCDVVNVEPSGDLTVDDVIKFYAVGN